MVLNGAAARCPILTHRIMARAELTQDPLNTASLKAVDSALFAVCLDVSQAFSLHEKRKGRERECVCVCVKGIRHSENYKGV